MTLLLYPVDLDAISAAGALSREAQAALERRRMDAAIADRQREHRRAMRRVLVVPSGRMRRGRA